MEIMIHEEKISHFTFHGEKKGWSRVTETPFTTVLKILSAFQIFHNGNNFDLYQLIW